MDDIVNADDVRQFFLMNSWLGSLQTPSKAFAEGEASRRLVENAIAIINFDSSFIFISFIAQRWRVQQLGCCYAWL